MEITGMIIFAVIGAWAGWRTGIFMRAGGTAALPGIILGVVGAVAGGVLFWFLTINIGGLISSIAIAVLAGVILLYLMGFFKKGQAR
jgi:uncharacterized membrane protein YeaQ/YmgE (transglycosylase-associated protein family)